MWQTARQAGAPIAPASGGRWRWPSVRRSSTRSPGFALFADLHDAAARGRRRRTFEEAWFPEGERILRQGLTGSGFYVILDGEAPILVDGSERARLGRGDFFGEVSILLGEPPIADVVAPAAAALPASSRGPARRGFLVAHPRVMYRMLQAQARRLRNANRWRS